MKRLGTAKWLGTGKRLGSAQRPRTRKRPRTGKRLRTGRRLRVGRRWRGGGARGVGGGFVAPGDQPYLIGSVAATSADAEHDRVRAEEALDPVERPVGTLAF